MVLQKVFLTCVEQWLFSTLPIQMEQTLQKHFKEIQWTAKLFCRYYCHLQYVIQSTNIVHATLHKRLAL